MGGDHDIERDETLDYIIYQDVMWENQDQDRRQAPRGGCLSMVVLLVLLSTSALLLI